MQDPKNTLAILAAHSTVIEADQLGNLQALIDGLQDNLQAAREEGRNLRIAVVGQMKAGKSSFLNAAILERDLLPKADTPTTVRVQVQNTLCDVLYGEPGCGWPLDDALQRIAQAECGVLVLLRPTEEPRDLVRRIQMLAVGNRAEEKFGEGAAQDQRTYGIGAQILLDLGVRKMHVMSAPKRFHALAGFGLEAVDYVSD